MRAISTSSGGRETATLPAWLETNQHLAVPITNIKELGDEKVQTIIMGSRT